MQKKDYLILESDFVISEKELNLISQIIKDNVILKRRNRDVSSNTLDLRLRDAFNHIEKKLLENSNERKKNDLREN
jgi:deoxycytidine triphosphate deaminase